MQLGSRLPFERETWKQRLGQGSRYCLFLSYPCVLPRLCQQAVCNRPPFLGILHPEHLCRVHTHSQELQKLPLSCRVLSLSGMCPWPSHHFCPSLWDYWLFWEQLMFLTLAPQISVLFHSITWVCSLNHSTHTWLFLLSSASLPAVVSPPALSILGPGAPQCPTAPCWVPSISAVLAAPSPICCRRVVWSWEHCSCRGWERMLWGLLWEIE